MVSHPFSLRGRRLLVTGASSGIGRASAVACASMGAQVLGVGRDPERLQATLAALQDASRSAGCGDVLHSVHQAELTQDAPRAALVQALTEPVHGVLHCAGISRLSPVRMLTGAHMQQLQAVNVEAPMLLTQALLKQHKLADTASMVFVASIAAHIGVPGVAAYSGTKAALIAMARCLAMEVVKRGMRVNTLSPALVETPLLEATATVVGSLEAERSHYPLGFGRPEDVAHAAVFLLSDASRWITGTDLVLDGGLTIR